MPASASDYFQKVAMATATTMSAPGFTAGDTSMNVAATTNWPTDTGVTFAVDEVELVDGEYQRVSGTYNIFRGTVAGATSINNITYVGGDAARNYSAGATTRVYILVSYAQTNRLIDGILVSHDQDGTLKSGAVDNANVIADGIIDEDHLTSETAKGWFNLDDTPDTVTYNGNRSYDLVFNSNDLTDTVSNGMRVKLARTVTPPTQCTDLESGSSQYYSKSSPNKMTFTDDFVCSAWIKLESYAQMTIVSRYNGTSGWYLELDSSGRVAMYGLNAGAANYSGVLSYQSIPLGKWVHVAAQVDMSAFTATTTTSYVMIDGVNVPATLSRGGTNPTALIQAGNLEIGGRNGGATPFDGKIAQVAVYSAKVTQATILASIDRTLTGSETSLASAYSFNNSIADLNTTTPNDLTANGGAGYATDSPFNATEYGIITANSFSTNTTLTVQVPEGYAIPTSGGVSSVYYSTQDVPYGFPRDKGKWRVSSILKAGYTTTSNATYGSFISNGWKLALPTGSWKFGWQAMMSHSATTAVSFNVSSTALTGLDVTAGQNASPYTQRILPASASTVLATAYITGFESVTTQTDYVMYSLGATTAGVISSSGTDEIFAELAYV